MEKCAANNAGSRVCPKCSKAVAPPEARFCPHCGTKFSHTNHINYHTSGRYAGLARIEGWLHVVSLFVFLNLMASFFSIIKNFNDPNDTLMGLEVAKFLRLINVPLIFYVAYLFLNRKKAFPKSYIAYKVFNISAIIIVAVLVNMEIKIISGEILLMALLFSLPDICICWYLLVSKRVQLTFTEE